MAGVAGFGLFLTVPAKPSTFPVLLTLSAATLLLCHGFRRAAEWTVAVLASVTIWLVVAVVSGVWPPNFLDTFVLALQFPLGQTTLEAIQAVVRLPSELINSISWLSKSQLIASAAALFLMVIPILSGKKWIVFRVTGFLLVVVVSASISGIDMPLLSDKVFVSDWPAPERTIAGLMILFSSLLMIVYPGIKMAFRDQMNIRLRAAIIFLLVSAPLLFSFGSYIGPLSQSGVVAGFLFLAAIVLLSFSPSRRMKLVLMSMVALVVSSITISGVAAGWQNPYGMAALENQVVQTSVGSRNSELYLTEDLNSSLRVARGMAQSHGWKEGTPLIDLTYPWNPGIPYFLGARVPDSLMMTIFGYANSQDIFEFHLSQHFAAAFPFENAWLLTTNPDSIDVPARNAVSNALSALTDLTGQAFPDGYDCIPLGGFSMWRPIHNPFQVAMTCDSSKIQ
jgi:intracellular septation protein A